MCPKRRSVCCTSAPEMLDPKARMWSDDGGTPYDWMSVPPVKEVAIQPATTDILLQPAAHVDRNADTVVSTRLIATSIY